MILAGAQRRWESFHRGLEFELDYGDNWAHFGLRYPPRLHNRISAQMIISGVCAALDAAGATQLRWTVDRVDETFGSASVRWQ